MSEQGVLAVIEGEPRPKERPRFNPQTGHAITPAKTLAAEAMVADQVKYQNIGKFGDPPWFPKGQEVAVSLHFHCSRALASTIGVPDLDNLTKLVLDALNKLVWADDRQVAVLDATVSRGTDRPRTLIRVEPIEPLP